PVHSVKAHPRIDGPRAVRGALRYRPTSAPPQADAGRPVVHAPRAANPIEIRDTERYGNLQRKPRVTGEVGTAEPKSRRGEGRRPDPAEIPGSVTCFGASLDATGDPQPRRSRMPSRMPSSADRPDSRPAQFMFTSLQTTHQHA